MPITRSVWIDDDGSGTTGTIINNAELQKIYDNVDAFLPTGGLYAYLVNSQTGTFHNWAPAGWTNKQHVLIHWFGGADTTITGIAGGASGQIVTIKNMGGSVLSFPNQSASSTVYFRNIATSAATPVGPGGSITYVNNQAVFWHCIGHEQGAWITPPFSAAEYAGMSPITWTVAAGNVSQASYRLSGRTLQWALQLSGTTLGGTNGAGLLRKHFGGFTNPAGSFPALIHFQNNAVLSVGVTATYGATHIQFLRDTSGGTPWTVGPLNLMASGTIEVT